MNPLFVANTTMPLGTRGTSLIQNNLHFKCHASPARHFPYLPPVSPCGTFRNVSLSLELSALLLCSCNHRNKHLNEEHTLDPVNILTNIDCNTIVNQSVNVTLNLRVLANEGADKYTVLHSNVLDAVIMKDYWRTVEMEPISMWVRILDDNTV